MAGKEVAGSNDTVACTTQRNTWVTKDIFLTTLTPGTRKKYCETGQCSTAEVNTSATHKNNLFSKLTYKFLTARLYQNDPQTKFSFLCEMQWNWKQ